MFNIDSGGNYCSPTVERKFYKTEWFKFCFDKYLPMCQTSKPSISLDVDMRSEPFFT
jgi:hypothetical protein